MSDWRWDDSISRYRDAETGRFLSREAALEFVNQSVQASSDVTATYASSVAGGQISPGDWEAAMRAEIKSEYIRQYLLGHGGRETMKPSDWGRIGSMVKEQYNYLKGFANEVAVGNLTPEQIAARAAMYTNSAREGFEKANRLIAKAAGYGQVHWVTDPSIENCFPAGVLIDTPTGLRRIENINVGDYVTTISGNRLVKKIFKRTHIGNLIRVLAGNNWVFCTPNHPFWTKNRGWIKADSLNSRDIIFLKNGSNGRFAHVRFPNTNDCISTGAKIRILGIISRLLLNLSFFKRFKFGMAMPPITIGLDNKISDFCIDNELGLNENKRFKRDTNGFENREHLLFEIRRIVLLKFSIAFHKCNKMFGVILKSFSTLLSHAFGCSRKFGRVIFSHIIRGDVINQISSNAISNPKPDSISFALNLTTCLFYIFGTFISSHVRIIFNNIVNLTVSPYFVGIHSPFNFGRRMPSTEIADSRTVMSTDRTCFSSADSQSTIMRIPTSDRTKSGMTAISKKLFFAKFTDFLHHHNIPHIELYTNKHQYAVYNLEVDEVHHYFANGFLVHNCEDCLAFEAMGWTDISDDAYGGAVPGSGSTKCLTNCGCEMEYSNPDTGEDFWAGE